MSFGLNSRGPNGNFDIQIGIPCISNMWNMTYYSIDIRQYMCQKFCQDLHNQAQRSKDVKILDFFTAQLDLNSTRVGVTT